MTTKVITTGNIPLAYVNVFTSDSAGFYVDPYFGTTTDNSGYCHIPDDLDADFITFSFVGYNKRTYPASAIPDQVTLEQSSNELAGVTITANPDKKFNWTPVFIGAGILAIFAAIYFLRKPKTYSL